MKAHSLDPKSMKLHLDLYLHLMFAKSTLTRAQREMIAVVVSQENNCRYCVTHHGEALLAHVKDELMLENLKRDFATADLGAKDLDLLTLKNARELKREKNVFCEFVRADARRLCFQDESFDCVVSFGSMLSEKYRLWMERRDRVTVVSEAVRVAKDDGIVLVNFVHRYWSFRGFLAFLKHYCVWVAEKIAGNRTELGDYTELIQGTPVRFHAFTIGEALSLFPERTVQLRVKRRGKGPFTDWFFVAARKLA